MLRAKRLRPATNVPGPGPGPAPDAGSYVTGVECDLVTVKTRGKSGKPLCGAGAEEGCPPPCSLISSERGGENTRDGLQETRAADERALGAARRAF